MGKAKAVSTWVDPELQRLRSYLDAEVRAAPEGVPFTVHPDVKGIYGGADAVRSERDLVQHFLDFANGDTTRVSVRKGHAVAVGADGAPLQMPVEKAGEMHQTGTETIRAQHQQFLAAVMADRKAAASAFLRDAPNALAQMWTVEAAQPSRGGLTLRSHRVLRDGAAFASFASILLLDETRRYGADLCQCTLPTCRRFFLVKKPPGGGRPRRNSCDDDCLTAIHNQNSKFRKRKAAKARRAK